MTVLHVRLLHLRLLLLLPVVLSLLLLWNTRPTDAFAPCTTTRTRSTGGEESSFSSRRTRQVWASISSDASSLDPWDASSSLLTTGFFKNETTILSAKNDSATATATIDTVEHAMATLPDNNTVPCTTNTNTTMQQDDDDAQETGLVQAPTYRELLIFSGTTLLIWLSEPLLSLVDTTVVGLTQGTAAVTQLASMGPATTLLDSLLYLTYFLAIGTTNQIAAARATQNVRQLQRTTSHTLGLATVLGLLTTAAVWVCGHDWLTQMAGASALANPALVPYAVTYAQIRATAAVPAVVGMVAQSVCLASLDTRTPAVAVVVASVLNILGDVVLAPVLGVAGAAWATAASNVASTLVLLRAVHKQMQTWRQQEKEQTTTTTTRPANTSTAPLPRIPMISWPDRKSLVSLLGLVGPIFFVICAKVACYSAMTLRTTNFGELPLAAQGIMMRLWFFFGCFGDSLSQTAQSYLPCTMYPKAQPRLFRKTLVRLLWMALGLGLLNSQMASWILQFGGGLFTNDSAILALMREHRHFIGYSMMLHPFIMCLEGTVIAARDFGTLVATYVVTLCLHFGILKWFCPSFAAVWRTFFLFQSIRLVNFFGHVWKKQRKNMRQEQTKAA